MKRSCRWTLASDVRRPGLAAGVLLVLLAQVTACEPAPEPLSWPAPTPVPEDTPPAPATGTPPVETSPFTLTASAREPDVSTEAPPPGGGDFIGVLTDASLESSYFRYDAYVVTAWQSGRAVIQSDVLEYGPQAYRYGYGYPLSMAAIEDGVSMTAYGGSYLQNALDTGTAIIDYPVVAGRQYILVYKTFSQFTPLKYRLKLSSELILEGRIHAPPLPVPIPTISAGLITLENPRPDALNRFVPWLQSRVPGN